MTLLAAIPYVADVVERPLPSRSENKGCVQFVVTAKGSHDIRDDLFQTCAAENIHVLEMSTKHASLEDVFIELTEQATGDVNSTFVLITLIIVLAVVGLCALTKNGLYSFEKQRWN